MRAFGIFFLIFCTAALPASPLHATAARAAGPGSSTPEQQDQQGGDDRTVPPASQEAQRAPAQSSASLPTTLTLPAGTLIQVRLSQWLSSDRNHAGDTFSAVLDQPLVVHGWVVARRGQAVIGRVDVAQKAREGKGVSRLGLEITELTLVDGEQLPISTEMQQAAPSPAAQAPPGHKAATVATTTVLGTIVGAAIGGGQGAAIGAGLGATAGVAAVLYTRGRPTVVAPETALSFRLQSPLAVSTETGTVAFQPVTQGDYKDQDAYANAPRHRGDGPDYPAPFYDYGYCGPWAWNCYPGPYWGPYIGWGVGIWGPGFGGHGRFRR